MSLLRSNKLNLGFWIQKRGIQLTSVKRVEYIRPDKYEDFDGLHKREVTFKTMPSSEFAPKHRMKKGESDDLPNSFVVNPSSSFKLYMSCILAYICVFLYQNEERNRIRYFKLKAVVKDFQEKHPLVPICDEPIKSNVFDKVRGEKQFIRPFDPFSH